MRLSVVFVLIAVVTAVIAVAMGLAAAFGLYFPLTGNGPTALATAFAGALMAAFSMRQVERGRWRVVMSMGTLACVLLTIGLLSTIWFRGTYPILEAWVWERSLMSLLVLAAAPALVALLAWLPMRGVWTSRLRRVTVWIVIGYAIMCLALIWLDPLFRYRDHASLVIQMGGVLVSPFVVMTLLLSRITWRGHVDAEVSAGPRLPLRLVCPRCGSDERLHTGGDHCAACGLAIRIVLP